MWNDIGERIHVAGNCRATRAPRIAKNAHLSTLFSQSTKEGHRGGSLFHCIISTDPKNISAVPLTLCLHIDLLKTSQ